MNKGNILIIEEDEDNKELLREVMDCYEPDYKKYFVSNTEEGIKFITETRADLILMEVSDGKGSYQEILKQLSKINEYSKTPIVAVTGHAMKGDRERLLLSGCSDYIAKPCKPVDLLNIIRKHLSFKKIVS